MATNPADGERLDVLPAGFRLEAAQMLRALNAAAHTWEPPCPVVPRLLLGADVNVHRVRNGEGSGGAGGTGEV